MNDRNTSFGPEDYVELADHAVRADVAWDSGLRPSLKFMTGTAFSLQWMDADGNNHDVTRIHSSARDDYPGEPKVKWPKRKTPAPRPATGLRSGPAVVVEGYMQHLAVASWAPQGYVVFGVNGVDGISDKNAHCLTTLRGRDVTIIFDADWRAKPQVRAAAQRVAKHLRRQGVTSVKLVAAPGAGSDGIDDLLARMDEDVRTPFLQGLLDTAVDVDTIGRGKLKLTRASDVEERDITWLWPDRIPYGELTVIDGDPDLGKSTTTVDIVARTTTGDLFPSEPHRGRAPATALVISAEDTIETTIVPRLRVAEADLDRVAFVERPRDEETGHVVPLAIPDDLDEIESAIADADVRLVVIDPIAAYWAEKIHTHSDASIRRAMAPLKDMAQRTGVAVVLVRHLNKSGDAKAMYRGGGSIGITAAARSNILIAPHPDEPDERRLLLRVKGNLAPRYPAWAYRIAVDDGQPRIEWLGSEVWSADDVLRGRDARKDSPARDAAEDALRELLADGPMEADQVLKIMSGGGHTPATTRRAADSLSVVKKSLRGEHGRIAKWEWSLPETPSYVDWNELLKRASDGQVLLDDHDAE